MGKISDIAVMRQRLRETAERELLRDQRDLERRHLAAVKVPKAPRRLHHLNWNGRCWILRIKRKRRIIINRRYSDIQEAIAVRDAILAGGEVPPGRPIGRPRGSFKRIAA